MDYAFAPLNNWFRCSGLEATERRGADRRSGIAFPHNRFRRHRHRRPRRVRLPPSRSPPVLPASQTGLRARTCGWHTGRLRGDCGVMCCFSFITILNPSCQIRPRPIHYRLKCQASTIISETPGTFVRARTRKGGEIRKGKALPSGRKKGEREGGWITVKRCARTATRRRPRPAGMLFPTAAAHSERSSKEGLHCTVKCARRSPVRRLRPSAASATVRTTANLEKVSRCDRVGPTIIIGWQIATRKATYWGFFKCRRGQESREICLNLTIDT